MSIELDPRFSFDTFVVGPANRLAVAAARRVAEAPGATYNPLFIYSASGLGKTHLLSAIGHDVEKFQGVPVLYETAEHLMEEISRAIEAGQQDAVRARLRGVSLVLLDDIQFLAGRRQIQDELIRAWDGLAARGGQVVLTSDRPPQDIDALDQRLVSRLSGGLIVDMGAPDYETRVAIARRKADERGQKLGGDVIQVLARIAFANVRELQGALNRVIAVQELEGRAVASDEISALLGSAADRGVDEFGEFLADITGSVTAVVAEGDRVLADAVLAWEGEGFRTRRLEGALAGTTTTADAEAVVLRFEQDVARLREIEGEIRRVDPAARELEAPVLRDPDRMAEAEALLASVRERLTPPPAPEPGIRLADIQGDAMAIRAARAVAAAPGAAYNPLYIRAADGPARSRLLAGLGNEMADRHGVRVAFVDGAAFEAELIDALARGRLESWRARYRQAGALIIDGLDALAGTEGAHDELFHLFEDLFRGGRQLVFGAAAAPHDLPLPDRLQSRLASGLVVETGEEEAPAAAPASPAEVAAGAASPESEPESEPAGAGSPAGAASPPAASPGAVAERPPLPGWVSSRERVLWEWPYADDWIVEPGA